MATEAIEIGRDGRAGDSTRQVLWLTAGAILLLVAIAAVALAIVSKELSATRSSQSDVEHTREILEGVQLVFSALQDAETGERGYVITGQPEFLEPHAAASRSLDGLLARLDQLIVDREGRVLLAELAVAARGQMEFFSRVIALRDREGHDAASSLIAQKTGKQQMDRIRGLVTQLHARESSLLTDRMNIAHERSTRAETVVQIALGASILLVVIAGVLLNRHVRRRVAAERAAHDALTLLTSSMDNLTQGVAVLDPEQRLIVWNSRFLELRGLAPTQVSYGMTLTQIMQAGAALSIPTPGGGMVPWTTSATPTVAQGMQPFDTEATRADGAMLQVRGRTMPGGNYIVTYTDVTALKRSEAAYREQATRLSSIVDNVVDAIITINESGSIESWSKGAERLFGYQAEEVLRRNVRMLMPDPHSSAHDGYIRNYLTTGERRIIGQRREVEAMHKDGHRVPVDLGISEMRIGQRRLFIGIIRDISARLEVERLKSGFVSTVSHELRTPLTSISGSLGLLAGGVAGQLAPKAARLIDIAKTNCERLVRLINDILDLEKAEAGKLELRLEALQLKAIVQQAIDLNRLYAHSYGVRIELDARGDDATVLVDHDRMMQVLTNLLSNAAKFSPRGGTIEVAIAVSGHNVQVSVRDHGPGIAPAFRERIFDKFAQADSSDSRAKGGTGLGLSIVKTIVERLGGAVGFDSEPGQGATFHITLPIRDEMPAVADVEVGRSPPGPAVLVCEDDPDVAHVLTGVLRHHGMRADAVGTALDARNALGSGRYDVAIVDLHLPDADGLELIAELRNQERTRTLPVIVMTGSASGTPSGDRMSTLQLADWLQKPINPQRLLDSIHGALRKSRGRRARILHVEDDTSLTQLVHELLDDEADMVVAHSLAEAREQVHGQDYDLVILDVALGDGSGLELLPLFAANGRIAPPVILYSATEPSRDITAMVQAALVKSRDSVEQLLANVRRLAGTVN